MRDGLGSASAGRRWHFKDDCRTAGRNGTVCQGAAGGSCVNCVVPAVTAVTGAHGMEGNDGYGKTYLLDSIHSEG
jgi:hypothetical protein